MFKSKVKVINKTEHQQGLTQKKPKLKRNMLYDMPNKITSYPITNKDPMPKYCIKDGIKYVIISQCVSNNININDTINDKNNNKVIEWLIPLEITTQLN